MSEIPKRPRSDTNESVIYYSALLLRHEQAVAVAAVKALRTLVTEPWPNGTKEAIDTLKRIEDSGWLP